MSNESKITIKDIAKICKVSVSTVSRAINNKGDINEDTKKMIIDTIEKLGYKPNSNARKLKIKQSETIAVLIKGISNPFFLPMFSIIEREINQKGYKFFLHKVEENDDEVEVALKLIEEEKPKGIIFLGGFYVQDKSRLQKVKVPFVITTIINEDILLDNSAYVGIDDYLESKKITNYLISLGHRKIAFIGARKDDNSIGMLRLQGYEAAHRENNIHIDYDIVITVKGSVNPYNSKYGYEMASRLIYSKSEFSAIYCVSDTIAIGAIKKLIEKGYKIPQDISVSGFDGLEINRYLNPTITTIKQPVKEIALCACYELFSIIKNEKKISKGKIIKFKGELWSGETTKKII